MPRHPPRRVAVDGGADQALRAGQMPEAVIGDFDSISADARARLPAHILHHIAEQETTDFDKALRNVAAPFLLAVGFAGARLDHGLAVLNTLSRHPEKRCIVMSGQDLIFLAPTELQLTLRVGARFSLFPMGEVSGESSGLLWPIAGLHFTPDGRVGTSNEVSAPRVSLRFSAPKMLVILPRAALPQAIAALRQADAPAAAPGE
ncbi:thiamine diphosphokinase [Thioclava sp. BHET1]|nr:thiamine diphosphokinase [Thioclava sp. BHET1]